MRFVVLRSFLLILLFTLLSALIIFTVDVPLTSREIREGYTAYSLIKTGKDTNGKTFSILFKADGNYLSTPGVYLRTPSIYFFGLNTFGVRFPGIFIGTVCAYSFYLLAFHIFGKRKLAILGLALFVLPLLFVRSVIFDVGGMFFLTIVLMVFNFWVEASKEQRKVFLKVVFVFAVLGTIYVVRFEPDYLTFLKRETFISDLLPSSYSYQIDKRLSFDMIYGSPLTGTKINFNRIVFNKLFYGANAFFKAIIVPFNFEKIFSPLQSQTVLLADSTKSRFLPSLYFWELPVIIVGYLFLVRRDKRIKFLFLAGFLGAVLLKGNLLFFLPAISVSEVSFLLFLITKCGWKTYGPTAIFSLFILGFLINLDLMINRPREWMTNEDYGNLLLWQSFIPEYLGYGRVHVTDRLGEPTFYYLYYERVDPGFYLNNRIEGPLTDNGIRKISSVGNVFFGTFKYYAIQNKSPNELWVDVAGQFVGENLDYKNVTAVPEGLIVKRILGITVEKGKFLGDELWFVKTTLNEN